MIESPPAFRRRTLPRVQEIGLLFVLLVLGAILSIYGWHDARPGRPNTFLNPDNLVEGVATPMSYYAIMAVGVTFVVISGGIDISVGSMMALAALSSAAVLQNFALDTSAWIVLPLAIGVPLAVGLVCGIFNGALIVGLKLHPFIVTLGTLSIFRGLANVLPPFETKALPLGGKALPAAFTTGFMRAQFHGLEIAPLLIMLLCVLFGWIFLSAMIWGRETYVVGGNEEAARFSGLNVNLIKLRVYALSGLFAGVAGMVSLGRFGAVTSNTGNGYELTVIAAAVVGGASLSGGRGSAIGALLGTLIIAMIEDGIIILHLAQEYRLIIIGSAIVLAVALDRFSEYWRERRLVGRAIR